MGDFIPAGKLESTAKPTPDPDAPSAASGANNMSSPSEILFWYPNLIGYARVVLAIMAFCLYENPYIFFWCYLISFTLDAADGHVARLFNQCSRFGAVLDMVTDRFATACLLVGEGHKNIRSNYLLQLYYHQRLILGLVCLGNELFYIFAYMMYFFPEIELLGFTLNLFGYGMIVCMPIFLLKQLLNVIQLQYSAWEIVVWEYHNEHQKK